MIATLITITNHISLSLTLHETLSLNTDCKIKVWYVSLLMIKFRRTAKHNKWLFISKSIQLTNHYKLIRLLTNVFNQTASLSPTKLFPLDSSIHMNFQPRDGKMFGMDCIFDKPHLSCFLQCQKSNRLLKIQLQLWQWKRNVK